MITHRQLIVMGLWEIRTSRTVGLPAHLVRLDRRGGGLRGDKQPPRRRARKRMRRRRIRKKKK
ncbi:hypothetical protein ACWDBO_54945, partial [Streptomyces mirabilis]